MAHAVCAVRPDEMRREGGFSHGVQERDPKCVRAFQAWTESRQAYIFAHNNGLECDKTMVVRCTAEYVRTHLDDLNWVLQWVIMCGQVHAKNSHSELPMLFAAGVSAALQGSTSV